MSTNNGLHLVETVRPDYLLSDDQWIETCQWRKREGKAVCFACKPQQLHGDFIPVETFS